MFICIIDVLLFEQLYCENGLGERVNFIDSKDLFDPPSLVPKAEGTQCAISHGSCCPRLFVNTFHTMNADLDAFLTYFIPSFYLLHNMFIICSFMYCCNLYLLVFKMAFENLLQILLSYIECLVIALIG